MSITIDSLFSQYSEHLGYIGIFLFFVTVDQLTPIPEEVTLLTIGYLASNHVFNPFLAGLVSLSAFLVVDLIYFVLARTGNRFIAKAMKGKNHAFINRYKEKLKHHFGPTLLVLCFIPRMRLFGPIFSGAMNLSWKRFILFDTLGLFMFSSLYIALGMIFHSGLHSQMTRLQTYQHYVFLGAMLLLTVIMFAFVHKSRKNESH